MDFFLERCPPNSNLTHRARSSLQQQLNGQVAQLQECQNREADVARQLQEALNAKQALEAAQAAQAAQVAQQQAQAAAAQQQPNPIPANPQEVPAQ